MKHVIELDDENENWLSEESRQKSSARVLARFVESYGTQRGWEHRKEKEERAVRELDPHLQSLWKKMQHNFKGTPESRAEQFKEYVDEHPGEEMGVLQDDADRELARLIRDFEKAAPPEEAEVPFA